ncbi:MAG: L-histidine N(alpha)-methyltransferase [Pseudomonadota bacterium]
MKIHNLLTEDDDQLSQFQQQFANDVLIGLQSKPKQIPAKYFYDEIGSVLFQKITTHEDYYLTRAEFEILTNIKDEIANTLAVDEIDIIELGAGDGHKTRLLIDGLINAGLRVNWYPIDISEKAMQQIEGLFDTNETLRIHGIVAEYLSGLKHVRHISQNPQLILFLGSNIGNLNRLQSQRFLHQLQQVMKPGDYAMIGFDLKKEINVLNAAYNDASGYTKEFNLNVLSRINRELGGNFNIEDFSHYGTYNPVIGAMESFLISRKEQSVLISALNRDFAFQAFEPIHLEYSFKYTVAEIAQMASDAKFSVIQNYQDSQHRFCDSLWQK